MTARVKHLCTLAVLCGCSTLLMGCAAMSEKDCLAGNWHSQGYEDGRLGKPVDTIASYTEACSEHGVVPDSAAYRTGYAVGLQEYCIPANGFSEGERNADYNGVCPPDVEAAFLDSYLRGLELRRENLVLEAERIELDLDNSRDERASLDANADTRELDDEIAYLRDRLTTNSFERQDVNHKIAQWSGRL